MSCRVWGESPEYSCSCWVRGRLSSASFRFRYLLGLLCHVALALVGCTPLPTAPDSTQALASQLSSCGAQPNFASETLLKRWRRFPVDIYVDHNLGALPEAVRGIYREGVEKGIGLWSEATTGRIGKFRVSYQRSHSPVTLSVTRGALPDNAIGITALTFTDERIVNADVQLTRSHYEGTPFLVNDIANTTAHEMGHVLGIVDHSPFSEDKMWVSGNFTVHNQGEDPLSLVTPRRHQYPQRSLLPITT